jgi:hypothetical protein
MRAVDTGLPAAFFFDDSGQEQAGLLHGQVDLLTIVRDLGVTTVQFPRPPRREPRSPAKPSPTSSQPPRAEAEHLGHERNRNEDRTTL